MQGVSPHITKLIEQFYLAAEGEQKWESVAEQLATSFNAHQAIIYRAANITEEGGEVTMVGLDPALQGLYMDIIDEDVWLQGMLDFSTPAVRRSEAIIDTKSLRQTTLYNELCKPADVEHMINGLVSIEVGSFTGLATQRSKRSGPFSQKDEAQIGHLLPHFQRALRLERLLRQSRAESNLLREVLDQHNLANLVVDRHGRIRLANRRAESLLREADGLIGTSGRLTAAFASDQARLSAALFAEHFQTSRSTKKTPMDLSIRRSGSRLPVLLALYPLVSQQGRSENILVFALDPENPPLLRWAGISTLYSLTKSEVRLAQCLVSGANVAESADKLGVAVSTLRSQLKSMFRKTGVSSQSQLVLLLVQSSNPLVEDLL